MSDVAEKAEVKAAVATEPKVTLTVEAGGIAIITLLDTKETHNTITEALARELGSVLDQALKDSAVKAAVVISGKPDSFVVGANIDMLRDAKSAHEVSSLSKELATRLGSIQKQDKPVVAAVHGQALGGGFEIALACHAIVASDDKKTTFGLPEVQLGLLPAANGMLRVAERAGLQVALDLALTGKNVRPSKAKSLGLVSDVVAASILKDVAVIRAKSLIGKTKTQTHKRKGPVEEVTAFALEQNPIGRKILFKQARSTVQKKTHGHYPAALRIIDVLECYAEKGFAKAAELEAKVFGELVVSDTSHRLIDIFFATTALKKDTGIDDAKVTPKSIEHVTVLGGGLMGGGIAYVTANAGIPVRIKEQDDLGVGRGLKHVSDLLAGRVKRKSLTKIEKDKALALVTGTTDLSGVKNTSIVIEAVFEDLELKQKLLREFEHRTGNTCIFASNTSSIPITKIAEVSKRPETVVGMHYFSPVHKMPLLEVIRTEKTAPWVVATAVALGKKQGKTVIVVKDGVGFYTSRILGPYMNEAAYLLAEGVSVEQIDGALVDWGWPVGAIQLLDEVGIDVAEHVGGIVHAAFGDRMKPPPGMAKLIADGRKGRKNEKGFYVYKGAKKGERKVDETVYKTLGVTPGKKLAAAEIQKRCALAFVNEAIHCLEEGILRSPRDGDIGAIFGLGFPPFRGGPFRYVDAVGASEVLRQLSEFEGRFGARFTPAPLLISMAKSGKRFYE